MCYENDLLCDNVAKFNMELVKLPRSSMYVKRALYVSKQAVCLGPELREVWWLQSADFQLVYPPVKIGQSVM